MRGVVLTGDVPSADLSVRLEEKLGCSDAFYPCVAKVLAVDGTVVGEAPVPVRDDGEWLYVAATQVVVPLVADGEVASIRFDLPHTTKHGWQDIPGTGYAHAGGSLNLSFKTPHRLIRYERSYVGNP